MKARLSTPALIAAVVALAALAGAAYAYDSSRDDLISDGVRVGAVDVGGLRADAARKTLRRDLADELERPVTVRVAGRRFRLTAARAHLIVDVDGMVDLAIQKSRSGGLPARLWRGLTGAEREADLSAKVGYSSVAVGRFARRVERGVNRPARDADVKFSTASLPATPSQTGLKVEGRLLRRSLDSALALPAPGRTVRARVKVLQPDVTIDQLADKYPYVITVDRPAFTLRFFKKLKLAKSYRIAIGQVGLETPAGLYHVQNKAINPAWSVPNRDWAGDLAGKVIPGGTPENPLKARWLGIYDGAGIHGTDAVGSLGTAASHGCIRMAIPDVIELYDQVSVQTPVYIQ